VPRSTYDHFADRDELEDVVLERMLAGVSGRRYRRAQEPIGSRSRRTLGRRRSRRCPARSCSATAIVVEANEPAAGRSARGGDHARRYRAARPHEHRGAGITTEGKKLALGVWDGSTENATVAAALLADLDDRVLDVEHGCCS
jgi:hypothetical protein